MLVYLDHAHIAALDVLLRQKPATFADFLAFWLEHGCELVISRAHLHEIGQSEDERDVEKRLEVLRYFSLWSGPIKENVDWVAIREIRHQVRHLLEAGCHSSTTTYVPIRAELYRRMDHAALEKIVLDGRPGWLDELHVRREYAALNNMARWLRAEYQALTSRSEPKWDRDASRLLPVTRALAPITGGDPVADRWMAEVYSRTPECWNAARTKRQAMICMYALTRMKNVERCPEEDLSRVGFHRELGRRWLGSDPVLSGQAPDVLEAIMDSFDPYDAPAISAALAVERGRKRHPMEHEASDFMDADHVLWAAHADLGFVDKRTLGYLRQARRNPVTAALLSSHLRVDFQRAATLNDVRAGIAAWVVKPTAAE